MFAVCSGGMIISRINKTPWRENKPEMTVMGNIDKYNIFKTLLVINLSLVAAYLLTSRIYVFPDESVRHWFDMDAEANIPTWFSSAQLLALSALSLFCARCSQNNDLRAFLVLTACCFLFFSVDEASKLHENLTLFFKKVSIHTMFPNAHGMWILVYPAILGVFLLFFWKGFLAFLEQKPGRTLFILGACVFVAGGVGFEIVGYYIAEHELDSIYTAEVVIEEGCELLGQSIMIFALLCKLEQSGFVFMKMEHEAADNEFQEGSVLAVHDEKNGYV